jgi:hypothetical protein
MEKERGIAIIGSHSAAKNCALEIAKKSFLSNSITVIDKEFNKPKTEFFEITSRNPLPEMWIDPNIPIVNYKKHNLTCARNRKKRKK